MTGDPDLRERSDWALDDWDEVGEVPSVEPLRHQSRVVKWVVWALAVVTIGLVLVAGYVGWWYVGQVQPDAEPGEPVAFTVYDNDSLDRIALRLERQGLIVDESVFTWYVGRKGGLEITPGYYQIPVASHMGDVLARLRTPPDQTYERVTFPEGFTIEQMAERLTDAQPRLDDDVFIAAATSGGIPSPFLPPGVNSLEGLLFPDTYQVSNADNEAQVVERMAGIMERVAQQEDLVQGAAELGRSPYEILTIASMIEKEAKLDADRAKIARVIYNRLFLQMPLQIDATLYYEGDRDTPFPVLRRTDSPYNTYMYQGLPPTPIANPGRASIRAALNPAPNPAAGDPLCRDLDDPTTGCVYLYYVLATEEGGHAFAVNLEQHEANIAAAVEAGIL